VLSRSRLVVGISLTLAALVAMIEPAFAGNGWTTCDQQTSSCTLTITVPGSTSGPQGSASGDDGTSPSDSGAASSPSPSPSRTLNTPCTYQADPSYKPGAGSDPQPAGAGAWYLMTCADALDATGRGVVTETTIVWLKNPPPAPAPDPATLAATAEGELKLSAPAIETSPRQGLATFPGVNVWAWIPSSSWSSHSATATAAGESVTATATPSYSTWDFGDGTVVTCQGPGTGYQPSDGPNPVSPN
jgi:hypothetical protein